MFRASARGTRLLYLLVGLALLGTVVQGTDLATVWQEVRQFGLYAFALVVLVYVLEFLLDSAGWQLTLPEVALSPRWLARLFVVRMVGEAFNAITPLGGLGGEPVKAVLLKKHYALSYRPTAASLVLAKTINLLALILFLGVGFVLLLDDGRFMTTYKIIAGTGLSAFALAIGGFYLVQRLKILSRTGRAVTRRRGALERLRRHLQEFDDRLVRYYTGCGGRFLAAFVLSLLNWLAGVMGSYVTLYFLGYPVSFAEAWMIEAFAQLVRAGTFFIPASIGAQEGALVLVCSVVTGSGSSGLAAAVVRRFRELLWVGSGLGIGYAFSYRASASDAKAYVGDGEMSAQQK